MEAKAAIHLKPKKGFSSQLGAENERRGWSQKMYEYKNTDLKNNYDWSRRNLNFEVIKGDIPNHGKVIPLGSQEVSLYDRYKNFLEKVGFKNYKDNASNKPNTCIDFIISGTHERLCEIAYGDPDIRLDPKADNSQIKLITSDGEQTEDIKRWALDSYGYIANKFGEDNVIGFEVHLDETTPHIHVLVIPTAITNQRGNVGGYVQIDENGNPVTYKTGKHIGEEKRLSSKKYEMLSDEKKKEYRPVERKKIETVCIAQYLGKDASERSKKLESIHDEYYEAVGKKWGLDRGVVIRNLPPEEQPKHRHKGKGLWWDEQQAIDRMKSAERYAEYAEQRAKEAELVKIKAIASISAAEERERTANEKAEVNIKRAEEAKQEAMAAERRATEAESKETTAKQGAAEAVRREQEALHNAYVVNQGIKSAQDDVRKAKEEYSRVVSMTHEERARLDNIKSEVNTWAESIIEQKALDYPSLDKVTFYQTGKNGEKQAISFRSLLKNAMEDIAIEISKDKPWTTSSSEWKKAQKDAVRKIITNMETIMFGNNGMDYAYKKAITSFGKSLYKDTQHKIAELTRENEALKQQNYELSKENRQLRDISSSSRQALEQAKEEAHVQKMRAEKAESELKDISGATSAMKTFVLLPEYAQEYNTWREDNVFYNYHIDIDNQDTEYAIVLPKDEDHILKEAVNAVYSTAEDIAGGVEEFFKTACLLYVNNYLAACASSSACGGCGGGGSENSGGWGQDKDEENYEWARRCARMALHMHRHPYRSPTIRWNKGR